MSVTLKEIDFTQSLHCEAVAGLWTGASGPLLALSPRFVSYATRPAFGSHIEGRFAWENDEPIGAIITAASIDVADNQSPLKAQTSQTGRVIALATLPESQNEGVATQLLTWAESWFDSQGVRTIELGGNVRAFVPGVPCELETASFFTERGYQAQSSVWDMAFNLAQYMPPESIREVPGEVRPAQPGQEAAITTFLEREFPDEASEFQRFVDAKGRLSDYMILWTERGIDGYCQLTFEDSLRTVESFYPYQLPRPWGQLGLVGVSQEQRGLGFGLALIDAGLRRLHNNGVNGCIINGTTLYGLFAKFGFARHREYQLMSKSL